jgi:hypothetical protein
MKGTLIKVKEDEFYLRELSKKGTGGAQCEITIGSTWGEGEHRLSLNNCNEIFGVYSPSKLSKVLTEGERGAFEFGYCLAREHNKDKLFTVDQLNKAYYRMENRFKNEPFEVFLEHIQQPTEIEVEIVMEEYARKLTGNGVEIMKIKLDTPIPKLDSAGCLILKRI